jgi:isocitrate/isopropylmalate dehydrogenase
MLNWMGNQPGVRRVKEAWRGIDSAVDRVLGAGKVRTPDLKGKNSTSEFGSAVAEEVKRGE